jgi:hypothetical protein
MAYDKLTELVREARDILDAEGHSDECILRCLQNNCRGDHGCDICTDDDDEYDDGLVLIAGQLYDAETLELADEPDQDQEDGHRQEP